MPLMRSRVPNTWRTRHGRSPRHSGCFDPVGDWRFVPGPLATGPSPWQKRHLLEPICREGRLPGMGTEADYRDLLAGAGFTVEGAMDVSRQVRGTWGICAGGHAAKFFTDREARAYLFNAASRNRVFLLTVGRIWLAYRTGAMRYLVWRARKPT